MGKDSLRPTWNSLLDKIRRLKMNVEGTTSGWDTVLSQCCFWDTPNLVLSEFLSAACPPRAISCPAKGSRTGADHASLSVAPYPHPQTLGPEWAWNPRFCCSQTVPCPAVLHVQSLPELNAILHFKDTQLFLQYDQLLKAVDSFTSGSTKKIETSPCQLAINIQLLLFYSELSLTSFHYCSCLE